MGIKLDWQIESDKGNRGKREFAEDPKIRRQRWRGLSRFITLLIVLLAIVGIVLWLISQRLEQLDQRERQVLNGTVQAEVGALRVGDRLSFMNRQRSADVNWTNQQATVFDQYETLKFESNPDLSGHILSTEIDGQRGRVQVQEIINGVPYVQTWFYWNYQEPLRNERGDAIQPAGWFHVPPDYTFWGEASQLDGIRLSVRYYGVDEPFAQALFSGVENWLTQTCETLDCSRIPYLTIDIVPVPLTQSEWVTSETGWQMIVPSPYIDRARLDIPFDTPRQLDVATVLGQNMINNYSVSTSTNYDADFLRNAGLSWLVGKWIQKDSQSYLMESIALQHGTNTIGRILSSLRSNSDVSVITQVMGTPMESANLDWRDFLTWRLQLEQSSQTNRDQETFLRLYDTRDETFRTAVYDRFNVGTLMSSTDVILVNTQTTPDGTPQLVATLTDNSQVIFNLVNGIWLRAS
jgi:hypothetical protein